MTMQFQHTTVLLHESVDGLAVKEDGIYIDGTFGRGGHSQLILSKLGAKGRLIVIDRDLQAIETAKKLNDDRLTIIHGPFSDIERYVTELELVGQIDGVLLDLGVSSPQLDDPERGFSFMRDGPLDMRMDVTQGLSAAEWLATAAESDIAWVLRTFGEEKFAKRIARRIVEQNDIQPLTRTSELAELIRRASPIKDRHKHPATRSFQAIRIFINSELDEVKSALVGIVKILAPKGKMAIISFHSLEDRLVKQFIRERSRAKPVPAGLPLTEQQIKALGQCELKEIKKIKPQPAEIEVNNRSRSAVLRIAEKLDIA